MPRIDGPRLRAMAGDDQAKPIYIRADGRASYAIVAQVMADSLPELAKYPPNEGAPELLANVPRQLFVKD